MCTRFRHEWTHLCILFQTSLQTSGLHATTECAMFDTNGNVNARLVSAYASHFFVVACCTGYTEAYSAAVRLAPSDYRDSHRLASTRHPAPIVHLHPGFALHAALVNFLHAHRSDLAFPLVSCTPSCSFTADSDSHTRRRQSMSPSRPHSGNGRPVALLNPLAK